MSVFRIIQTVDELIQATQDIRARYLILRNNLSDVPTIKLKPFQSLTGEFKGCTIRFADDTPGICLNKANELRNLQLIATDNQPVIFQAEGVDKIGTHQLSHLTLNGYASFIYGASFEKGKIEASFIHFPQADTTALSDRPMRYDCYNQVGAFTLWNKSELESTLKVKINQLSFGSAQEPINASGLMLWGNAERKGAVKAEIISLGATYMHTQIPCNAPDLVAAALCNGYQAKIEQALITGEILTQECNEMGIYNWGEIDTLTMTAPLTTRGANACGIIQAGVADHLNFTQEVKTHGTGARAFFMYDGHIKHLYFNNVTTHGDAATAIQFSRHIDHLTIDGDVNAYGDALNIKMHDGAIIKASADAIGVKYGGSARLIRCSGNIISHGNDVRTIYNEASIERLLVQGQVLAKGEQSVAMEVNQGYFGGENIHFVSEKWAALRVESAKVNHCHNLSAKGKNFDLLIDILSSVDRNIFAKEFLSGIFQDDVEIEYLDNLHLSKEEAPELIAAKANETDLKKN